MLLPAMTTTGLLFGGALAGAIRASLEPDPFGPASLDAWRAVLGDPSFWDALVFSTRLALVGTGLAAASALATAAVLRGRGPLLQGLFALPVLVPHLVAAVVLALWAGPGGIADRVLGPLAIELIRDRVGVGIVLVYLYKEVPFLVLLLLATWGPEVTKREEAATMLGAGPWVRLRWVVWPSVRGPLVIGSLIVAAFIFGSLEVPLVVGPTHPVTLPVLALHATRTAQLAGRAQAAAILLVAAAASILLAAAAVHRARRTNV